jgi:hypothetical protein
MSEKLSYEVTRLDRTLIASVRGAANWAPELSALLTAATTGNDPGNDASCRCWGCLDHSTDSSAVLHQAFLIAKQSFFGQYRRSFRLCKEANCLSRNTSLLGLPREAEGPECVQSSHFSSNFLSALNLGHSPNLNTLFLPRPAACIGHHAEARSTCTWRS